MKYLSLRELVELIEGPNQKACSRILEENLLLFKTARGASYNHQAWRGGYYDHVREVMNIAVVLYSVLASCRPLTFSLSDALLVLFLHDIEKPWKYQLSDSGELEIKPELVAKEAQHAFRAERLAEYGVELTEERQNGLRYVEGEYKDYSSKHRVMGPLSAFCHMCDVASARIWHDCPAADHDEWLGAVRTNVDNCR